MKRNTKIFLFSVLVGFYITSILQVIGFLLGLLFKSNSFYINFILVTLILAIVGLTVKLWPIALYVYKYK